MREAAPRNHHRSIARVMTRCRPTRRGSNAQTPTTLPIHYPAQVAVRGVTRTISACTTRPGAAVATAGWTGSTSPLGAFRGRSQEWAERGSGGIVGHTTDSHCLRCR
ncbi:hypothetical protein B0H34DRAFT_272236 [Crassisporium funariophilum]|nr:hypothetical protein B0H34DRAFT_272236 [Crassisporium funariophilum]